MSRRVLILTHPTRPAAVHTAESVASGLRDRGMTPIEESEVDDGDIELAIVLGGDGTILRAAELIRGRETPLVGINLGHVGFLAESEVDRVADVVRRAAERDYVVEERMTLDVTVQRPDSDELHHGWAINEASVEKSERERMIEVAIGIDERGLSTFGCDGVVLATPTGSTAYAFSAGGPVVWPDVEAMLLTPISAHALFARPLVVGPDSRMSVEILARSYSSAVVWCDGRRRIDAPPGSHIDVVRGAEPVRLARLNLAPFTDRLVGKFNLPVAGWRGGREAP
ncbi:NAD kinase [Occultella aeris]|uniref:NAD kinase n=1 Tax=Occultella aeris TaxID=2761496 RepID=A0A7M4DR79_9MICO|nr:NAD kinase [Occultella aeris]VZO39973.1 Inorganic polyphosphate/ATP-NAD kinase [Occultella aeris]